MRGFFLDEYQWAAQSSPVGIAADVSISYARTPWARQRQTTLSGGYKTVGWRVRLSRPDVPAIGADIELRGGPRDFGLSLTQGYFIEPLLSLAMPARGRVLLPAAAIDTPRGLVVLMGRSRSGKSTVSARALATGWAVLGDDQVIIDEAGRCASFPRRMRLYSDLEQTAPAAHQNLPVSARRGLAIRKHVRRASRGYVAPPVRVPATAMGPAPPRQFISIAETILIERTPGITQLERLPIDVEDIVTQAGVLLAEQRAKLAPAASWADRLAAVAAQEATIVRASLAAAPTFRVRLPDSLPAADSIAALSRALELDRPPPE